MTRRTGCVARAAGCRPLAFAWAVAFVAALVLPGSAAWAASTTAGSDLAPAEKLLFMTTHMSGVEAQTELDYAFNLSGPPAKINDTVRVLVTSAANAKSDAHITDRSGNVEVSGEGLPCNPVILYFLEHDIAEMEQLTGGQRRYFQRRVRLALAAGPPITPVVMDVGGKPVKAQKIVIQPYLDDPNAARFAQYVGKRYTFIIADEAVPGRVMSIHTEVPGANNDFAHPLQTETLSFTGALHSLVPPPAKPGQPAPVKSPQAPRASR
ncbi:hypothetical protein [Paraburkholderia saeva]|uniref:DUF1571 domain-containing protein n=1 Tax=Paraburkholderia saeva TaxID=2777537 RepID=A0A9N8RXA0_9BURK|nr:hypothetical protein [Paraburkholderia saeva]CAG4897858.1 hypothetical protein LMG31841_02528 [Paraburkholderia saeva]CAG4913123.1 hypothetical protein R52603_04097 [Paraburkholderia saeva]CAG4919168.1 hypothetical protein R70241_04718 [Paraburkholderia saeva]